MKKIIALMMSVCMLLTFAACGNSKQENPPKEDEKLITITDYSVRYKGYEMMKDEEGNDSIVLTYDFINNSKYACAFGWNVFTTATQGTAELQSAYILAADGSGKEITAAILDNVEPGATLEVKGAYVLANTTDDVVITFSDFDHTIEEKLTVALKNTPTPPNAENTTAADESTAPATEVPTATDEGIATQPQETEEQLTDFTQWWDGNWYGWWTMRNCEGSFAENDMEGAYWDCCAELKVDSDGNASLLIWDETMPKEDALAEITLTVSKDLGDGQMGAAITESGYFLGMSIEHGDFIIDPAQCDYKNFFVMNGWYDDGENSCYIELFMRPWGQDWQDVSTSGNTMPYDEMLPFHYADWYIPAIEAGSEMPDVIGGDYQ